MIQNWSEIIKEVTQTCLGSTWYHLENLKFTIKKVIIWNLKVFQPRHSFLAFKKPIKGGHSGQAMKRRKNGQRKTRLFSNQPAM